VITDNTGGVVPGVTVKAVEVATGLSRDAVTDANGRYIFTSLRPTTFDIIAELSGFRSSQRKGVLLQANENLTVNFAIEVGTLAETVTVSANRRPSTSPRRPSAKSSTRSASSSCR